MDPQLATGVGVYGLGKESILGRKQVKRTGIDFGTMSVKIVHAVGSDRIERITHLGSRNWDRDDEESAADSVRGLLKDLGLSKKQLGRVAVSISSPNTIVREVTVPAMSADEFRQSTPFEARKYMQLQESDSLISDGQVLVMNAKPDDEESTEMTALIAATTSTDRAAILSILSRAGIEPEVIDTEPTASLNALLGTRVRDQEEDDAFAPAFALLDLGGRRASLYISADHGGFMSRTIWEGSPPSSDEESEKEFIRTIATRALETLTFYRGRFRREVSEIRLMGGGALKPGRSDALAKALNRNVETFDPLRRPRRGCDRTRRDARKRAHVRDVMRPVSMGG